MIADPWQDARQIIGEQRITLGPQASDQFLNAPEHLLMVLARYRAAAALIGDAVSVLEIGCGEGIGAGILARGRHWYLGIDTDAAAIALTRPVGDMIFLVDDVLHPATWYLRDDEAVVALDVIEHIPTDREDDFMRQIVVALTDHGVCVVGSPSKNAEHLASPQSRAGHCNLYTPERLKALMARYFHVVQMLYMQDTAIHLGHPSMAHYILAVGIGPRRG